MSWPAESKSERRRIQTTFGYKQLSRTWAASPMEQDSYKQFSTHKCGLFVSHILSDTQLLFCDTGSWKQAKHNEVSLDYLNLVNLQLSTGQFLCQMHRVHTEYPKGTGSSGSLAEGGKLWATLTDRRAVPTDSTGHSCINAIKPHTLIQTCQGNPSLLGERGQ